MRNAESPERFFAEHGSTLFWMGFVALIARPVVFTLHDLLIHQALTPTFVNMIRWQTHRYVLRQSMGFFQNDFAGRITTKVVQTGSSLRESAVQTMDAMWFMLIYISSAIALFTAADPRLAWPLLLWLAVFVATLVYFVPRIKERSRIMSEARSMLTGRIVDSYTNILTVKLFAHAEREDDYARFAIQRPHREIPGSAAPDHAVEDHPLRDQRRADRRHRRRWRSGSGAQARSRSAPSRSPPASSFASTTCPAGSCGR